LDSQKIETQPMRTIDPMTTGINKSDASKKENSILKNESCRLSLKEKAGRQAKESQPALHDNMDAIAYGVEAWLDKNSGYSRRVREITIEIAQTLGIPEDEIERWSASQLMHDTEKSSTIKSLLEKLQTSFPSDQADIRGILKER